MVQYIPTIGGIPITPEKPSPIPVVAAPIEVREKPKQKYPSLMNKTELMEAGKDYGLELTEDMTRKVMQDKIRKAKKNGNGTGTNKSSIS